MRSRWLRTGCRLTATLAIVCATLPVAGATAARVSTGWAWRNAAPLGRIARGVVRAGPYEYAIGDDGTLLRSDDSGSDWIALDTGSEEHVQRLEVIDPATLVIGTGTGCGVRMSTDAGQTFAPLLNTSSTCGQVAAFSFVSPSVGFVLLRDGAVERTIDGGQSFSAVAAIPGSPASIGVQEERRFATFEGLGVDLHFSSPSSGIAFLTPASGPSTAYATSDGGAIWKQIALPSTAEVEHVDFVNAATAYAAGPNTLLYSGDGGASWQAVALAPTYQHPEAVFCGFASGCLAKLWLTRNVIAVHGAAPPSAYAVAQLPLCDVSQQLPAQIVTVPARTTNENASLLSGESSEACSLQSARAEIEYGRLLQGPGKVIYAPGTGGHLALSRNEGQTWKIITMPTRTTLTDASFASSRDGLTLDGDGVVRETDDGGASWRTLASGTKGAPRAVAMTSSRDVLVLGANGIRRSRGAGVFVSVGGRVASTAHLTGFDVIGSTVFAYGEHVLLRSTDSGAKWTALRFPRRGPEGPNAIVDISFVSRSRGYLLDVNNTLWSTSDAGRQWRQVLSAGPSEATSVDFVNAEDGYLEGLLYPANEDDAYVLHTSDGGATWSPEFVGPGWLDSAIVADGAGAAVMLQEQTADDQGTMFYATKSFGESGRLGARIVLHASQRAISGRELFIDHGSVRVTVSGALSTGVAGQRVIVAERDLRGSSWNSRMLTTGAGGRFSARWLLHGSSIFVAQWIGEPGQTGAGSRPLRITAPLR